MNHCLDLISYWFDAVILYFFNRNFFYSGKALVSKWVLFAFYAGTEFVGWFSFYWFHQTGVNIIVSIVGLFIITFLYSSTILEKFISVFIFQVCAIVSELLANVIIYFLPQNRIQYFDDLGLFLSKIILFSSIIIIQLFQRKKTLPSKYLIWFICIPLTSIIVLFGIYNSPIPNDLSMYLFASGILVINFVAYYLLSQLAEYITQEDRTKRLALQVEIQKEKYMQLTSAFYRGNRILHDVNKHLRYIHQQLEQNKTSEAIKYIEKIDASLEQNYNTIQSGNMVIDSILSNMKSRLESVNCGCEICINLDIHKITLEDYDLVIILGNIVDNQIEAVTLVENEEYKKASISMSMSRQALLIHAKNGYEENKINKKNSEKWFHGLGLQNVKEIVEQYGGSMTIQKNSGWFETMIMIPFGGENEDESK